jgi:hypothetical protein
VSTTTTGDVTPATDGLPSSLPPERPRDYSTRLAGSLEWVSARAPELALVGFGCVLRLATLRSYPAPLGYDFFEHERTINWWTEHFAMPPFLLSRGSYHPQLYYLICGLIQRLGGTFQAVQAFSVLTGCARLLLTWWAAERYLKTQRVARLVLLALAAGMPVALQMDAMVTQEPLNNLLSLAFAICMLELGAASDSQRLRRALYLGVVTGFGLLIKVSNLALLGVLGLSGLLEWIQRRDLAPSKQAVRFGAWVLAGSLALGMAAPQYIYNREVYGKALLDGWYHRPTADTTRAASHRKELLDRRTLGFVFGFSTDIVRFPYSPSGIEPTPRFWSALIATSYCDYFNYRFNPPPRNGEGSFTVRGNPVSKRVTNWARASVASGIGIALLTVVGWLVVFWGTLKRRELARPAVLLMPAVGLCGALYFTTQYPYDFEGVVKGHYFHFVSPPLYAVFGASVAWLLRRRWFAPLGWVGVALLIPPAVYSTLCSLR